MINKELILTRGYATREELQQMYESIGNWNCFLVCDTNDTNVRHSARVFPLENQRVTNISFRFVFLSVSTTSYCFFGEIPRPIAGLVGIAHTDQQDYIACPVIYISQCLHMFAQAGVEAIEYDSLYWSQH